MIRTDSPILRDIVSRIVEMVQPERFWKCNNGEKSTCRDSQGEDREFL